MFNMLQIHGRQKKKKTENVDLEKPDTTEGMLYDSIFIV